MYEAEYDQPLLPRGSDVYSTVLRMASPSTRIWIHYDVCDNILCQVSGRKMVRLWRPERAVLLGIDPKSSSSKYGCGEKALDMDADSSPITRKRRSSRMGLRAFANVFNEPEYEVILSPGDVVRIPALWPHTTIDMNSTDSGVIGISVNAFYKTADLKNDYAKKDAWCNADYGAYTECLGGLDKLSKMGRGDARLFYLTKLQSEVGTMIEAEKQLLAEREEAAVAGVTEQAIFGSNSKSVRKTSAAELNRMRAMTAPIL